MYKSFAPRDARCLPNSPTYLQEIRLNVDSRILKHAVADIDPGKYRTAPWPGRSHCTPVPHDDNNGSTSQVLLHHLKGSSADEDFRLDFRVRVHRISTGVVHDGGGDWHRGADTYDTVVDQSRACNFRRRPGLCRDTGWPRTVTPILQAVQIASPASQNHPKPRPPLDLWFLDDARDLFVS